MNPNGPTAKNIRAAVIDTARNARELAAAAQQLAALAEAAKTMCIEDPAHVTEPGRTICAALLDARCVLLAWKWGGEYDSRREIRAQLERATEAADALDIDHPARVVLEDAN
jgi:hypothetical protein